MSGEMQRINTGSSWAVLSLPEAHVCFLAQAGLRGSAHLHMASEEDHEHMQRWGTTKLTPQNKVQTWSDDVPKPTLNPMEWGESQGYQ